MIGEARRENNFDLIRLIAATQVVIIHAFEHLKLNAAAIEWLQLFPGVPIFFVISGFLVSASYEKSKNLFSYTRNRVLRIYPGLWACFLLSIISVEIFYRQGIPWRDSFAWIFSQISIAQFYNPDFLRGYGVGVLNGSLWTIPVELQFYILLPLTYLALDKANWNKWLISGIFILLISANQINNAISGVHDTIFVKLFGVTATPYFYMFLIGVIFQRNRQLITRYLAGKIAPITVTYLLLAFILHKAGIPVSGNSINPASTILLGCLVIGAAHTQPWLSRKILRGHDISYGIYIYHMIAINIFVELGLIGSYSYFLAVLAITFLLATFSWMLIEKPALGLKKYKINFKNPSSRNQAVS